MIAEINIFGVFLHSALFGAILAGLVHVGARRALIRVNFYNWVWHRNLVDLAVFVLLWGCATLLLNLVGQTDL